MSLRFTLFLTLLLGIAAPARAQIFQITASGTITGATGSYSTVPLGTAFTFTETFNAATAAIVSSTATSATYADPAGTSTFSFDGVDLSGTSPQVEITSNQPDPGDPSGGYSIYGFEFGQLLPNSESYGVQLLSIDSSVAPSTSLGSLHTSPVSDFFSGIGNTAVYYGAEGPGDAINGVGGVVTSFSVESVPEPSSVALSIFAGLLFLWLRGRQRHEES